MIRIIKTIPFQRFHKSELRNLVKEVIETVNAFPALLLLVKILYERLKSADDLFAKLNVRHGKHPATTDLQNVRIKSMDLIKSILAQVKTLKLARLESQSEDLLLVEMFVKQYLKPIVKGDWSDRAFSLDKMFEALDADTNLQAVIERLNMKMLFDELLTNFKSQDVIKSSRIASIRGRKKANTREVRSQATIALQELFAAIELAQIEHPELDFSVLVTGINQRVEYYTAQTKIRNTRNKNKPENANSQNVTNNNTKAA